MVLHGAQKPMTELAGENSGLDSQVVSGPPAGGSSAYSDLSIDLARSGASCFLRFRDSTRVAPAAAMTKHQSLYINRGSLPVSVGFVHG